MFGKDPNFFYPYIHAKDTKYLCNDSNYICYLLLSIFSLSSEKKGQFLRRKVNFKNSIDFFSLKFDGSMYVIL